MRVWRENRMERGRTGKETHRERAAGKRAAGKRTQLFENGMSCVLFVAVPLCCGSMERLLTESVNAMTA
jgi:hypothetical protein